MKLPWRDSSDQPKHSAPNEVAARLADAAAGRNSPPPQASSQPSLADNTPPTEATHYAEAYFSHNPEQAHSIVEQQHYRGIPLSFLVMAVVLLGSIGVFYYNFVFTAHVALPPVWLPRIAGSLRRPGQSRGRWPGAMHLRFAA